MNELGYDVGRADGSFGPRTERVFMAFQLDKKLSVDGVIGNQTWNVLFQEPIPTATAILDDPPPYSYCFDIYGDFRLAGWREQNLVRCDLSAYENELKEIYFSWMESEDKSCVHRNWFGFMCHKLVAPHFQAAVKRLVEKDMHKQLRTFDGCFNVRQMRGSGEWPTHSWGIAIDLDAPWNRFGQTAFEMAEEVAKCFEDEGFAWGGRWSSRPDAMHFQYCTVR